MCTAKHVGKQVPQPTHVATQTLIIHHNLFPRKVRYELVTRLIITLRKEECYLWQNLKAVSLQNKHITGCIVPEEWDFFLFISKARTYLWFKFQVETGVNDSWQPGPTASLHFPTWKLAFCFSLVTDCLKSKPPLLLVLYEEYIFFYLPSVEDNYYKAKSIIQRAPDWSRFKRSSRMQPWRIHVKRSRL